MSHMTNIKPILLHLEFFHGTLNFIFLYLNIHSMHPIDHKTPQSPKMLGTQYRFHNLLSTMNIL